MNSERKIQVEQVNEVPKPAKARVEDAALPEAVERKRDYLEGFLAKQAAPAEPAPTEPAGDLYEAVIDALKEIYDPEIPIDIYELGLIYDVTVSADNSVLIQMTLTAPGCPVAGSLPGEVETKVESIPEVKSATVNLVWEPPWDKSRMSEAALLQLGM